MGTRLGDGEEAEQREGKSTSTATETKVLPDVNKRPIPQTKDRYHEVRRGETLYRIAKKYDISVEELCRLNDINSNKIIQPAEKLLISSEKNQ
jgi:LysM repeat protein